MPGADGGLGTAFIGEKIAMGNLNLSVTKLLGEGGFSYVYLVKHTDSGGLLGSSQPINTGRGLSPNRSGSNSSSSDEIPPGPLVLKVTSIHSRSQRDIAEKEAKLLSRLSHPSIIKMYSASYRTVTNQHSGKRGKEPTNSRKERPQHCILMEYCEGGHALDVCNKLATAGQQFDLSTLIIAFGQICNAVSYLHAQRPPIVHRDLKPVNFLVKNGAYKLCDFGSAVFGHVDLRTQQTRAEAEEVVQKTTTQMFRAPEMVDLYVAKKLTQSTDVWALGCCLYSLAFLRNCFEEGSNLAILSRNYTIPDENPYGGGLIELIDRMLTVDYKARADMTEVILCLSAVYSGRPLPPRKKSTRSSKAEDKEQTNNQTDTIKKETQSDSRIGRFRTDSQGYRDENIYDPTKAIEGKKLASNSVAARRKRAAASSAAASSSGSSPTALIGEHTSSRDPLTFSSIQESGEQPATDIAFSSFGDLNRFENSLADTDFFEAFDNVKDAQQEAGANDGFDPDAFGTTGWGENIQDSTENFQKMKLDDSPDDSGDKSKKDDAHRTKSRRKREGGGKARTNRDAEPRSDYENTGTGGEKKDWRSRTDVFTKGEDDKEYRQRRRSTSRTRRKSRTHRQGITKTMDEKGGFAGDAESKMVKAGSFRNIFNRKQGGEEP
mmetsp:Transcript_3649/g.7835  ORF Transcript_3649/g.7835 Transcript_3649/m.7835 type:complete len:661 (-) Transcript_3649:102-2084(-)|eukprot:CAMPEP_0168165218 /NCGR_PEP_ID=MMETSP0139_2-20121125/1369_1 /TAXON_ID=44445 /ORGANISM="Pseudo-nitzschia australis, Strain 10249 10 AB" /LENGTH=660 /DNA_ID=CAMNT_0008082319 /DNA_START=1707 /DNA_END=3689 /DNA_ORIENTATION=-